jgi:hypothetical protein
MMKMLKGMALLLVLSSAAIMVAVTPEDIDAWKKATVFTHAEADLDDVWNFE